MKHIKAALVFAAAVLIGGCGTRQGADTHIASLSTANSSTQGNSPEDKPKKGGHETAHGGALNAIVKCEIGHAEVKRESDTLHIWFVGGAPDTTKAVPIPDKTVTLHVTLPGAGKSEALVLKPEPLDLAGETVGNCSRFVATAPWLQNAGKFTATGNVTFKGQKQPLRIEYPEGYDPD